MGDLTPHDVTQKLGFLSKDINEICRMMRLLSRSDEDISRTVETGNALRLSVVVAHNYVSRNWNDGREA